MTTGTRMPKRFVPQYDVKIRGGRLITEWRFGAHPTVHAVSPSGVPLVLRQKPQNGVGARTGVGDLVASPGGGNRDDGGNPGNFSVLPPIKDSGKRIESFSLSELDDISLKNEVLRNMKEMSDRGLQGLLANLRAQDRDRDGVLSTDVVKGTLKKYQLKLSEEGMKNLCKKFGEAGTHVTMVRYEDMINYLAKSRMEALRAPPPMPGQRVQESEESGSQPQPMPPKQQHPRKVNLRNRVLFSDKDEAQLISDMERQLSGKPVNMADLRRTMYDLDRDRNDFLSGKQVEVAFSKCGVYLTPDVRARLLLATDRTGAGMYKIETLMDYLTRVKPETHYTVELGNSHRPRQARVGRHPIYQNQPMLNAPWELTQQEPNTHGELPDEGFSEEQQQQQRQRLQQLQEVQPLAPPPPNVPEETELPFDVQKWSSDYQYLAQAVYQADHDQSDYMPAEEVQHISSTYNLVYNLQISEQTLLTALNTATDETYGEVNLEYFIAALQDLHFRESGAY
ncbi:uncharacterized protein LOC123513184 isoform X1 [Portunus trituberculatus]|uniref:uncharacterized protein LOC123513184 isoform X1 n=1 Tax=Portunus trituberculatus TaxID=210409 RepID=UPI001E1D1AD7|nr:uncharacterized protein LOC123513184 isoform X1 [Portunus trituberculatus]XP_045126094.1 uncharacterized protein LOC123513184 isoform X1 [Portunus trituberculatus]